MSVLVTGGAGYIGSHTVRSLHEANEGVVVIDNLSTGFSAFLPEGVPLFIGDAGDENLVEGVIAQHAVDSIIHFAGSVVVPDFDATTNSEREMSSCWSSARICCGSVESRTCSAG